MADEKTKFQPDAPTDEELKEQGEQYAAAFVAKLNSKPQADGDDGDSE